MDIRSRQHLTKPHMLLDPNGKVYYIRLLDDFCSEINKTFPKDPKLSARQLRKLSRGSIEEYRGWTNAKRNNESSNHR